MKTAGETRILKLAESILEDARMQLLLHLRFMDRALAELILEPSPFSIACDGRHFLYDPVFVIRTYQEEQEYAQRVWLHILMHCLFSHVLVGKGVNYELWDLACDVTAEYLLAPLLPGEPNPRQQYRQQTANMICTGITPVTAENVYRRFMSDPPNAQEKREWKALFEVDNHSLWYRTAGLAKARRKEAEKLEGMPDVSPAEDSAEDAGHREAIRTRWKKLAEQMESQLLSSSLQQGTGSAVFSRALGIRNRKRMNLQEFLIQFASRSEVLKVSQDEFDYIYYTYGLALYGNMPMIEPLEYRDDHRIHELVIAIDTSGSISKEKATRFLEAIWSILGNEQVFAERFRLHILQCDTEIRSETVLSTRGDLDHFLGQMTLRGFGGTDFRPVFAHVNQLIQTNRLTELRGLLYLTDGLGQFPKIAPPYKTAFLFVDTETMYAHVPAWAITAVLEDDGMHVYHKAK